MNIRGERILIFGDSLTHHGSDSAPEVWNVDAGSNRASSAPGDLLASMLLERGAAAVRTDARVGRSAMNFYSRENAKQLLADDVAWAPTKVVVMLGTNDIGRSPDGTRTAMTSIRDTFKGAGAEVWAIGPPLFVGASEALNGSSLQIVDIMKSVFGGRFVDARYPTEQAGALQNRAKDGVHFTAASARPMAETLAFTLSAKISPTVWWTIGAIAAGAGGAYVAWRMVSARLKKGGTAADGHISGASSLRWKKVDRGVYEASSAHGTFRIDGNNAGRNRWTVTYPDGDYAMADALTEAKLWAEGWAGDRKPLGDIDINILRHENKWMKIGSMPKAAGYKQIPCKSGLDKQHGTGFRVRCWSK